MKKQYPLYPEIDIDKSKFTDHATKFTITTTIRVLHTDGLYYRVLVKDNQIIDSEMALYEHFSRFHRLVYMTQLFHEVDLNLKNQDEEPVYRPDHDQSTEIERMYKHYSLNTIT